VIGIRRVEYDDARQQTLEKYIPAVEHGGEERDHRIAALVMAQFGSVPLTVVREVLATAAGSRREAASRVPVHETADLEFVGDGPGHHRGLLAIREVEHPTGHLLQLRAQGPRRRRRASSGCMTATLIALDSMAACRPRLNPGLRAEQGRIEAFDELLKRLVTPPADE